MAYLELTYTLISVLLVSIISLIGTLFIFMREEKLSKFLIYMVSFSAGVLFGDAFIHLIPKAVEEGMEILIVSSFVLLGIIVSFVVEKVIRWHHCHHCHPAEHYKKEYKKHHPFAFMNLFGEAVHNFIDGLIIGASYLASIPVGIATTIAVILHEIPQEIGDFGVLLKGGFGKKKALLLNFLIALTAVLGGILAVAIGSKVEGITLFLIPFAAGTFIYIAGSDLIPELHKRPELKSAFLQLFTFLAGIGMMVLLLLLE